MARFEFKGLDEYLKQLRDLGEHTQGYCKRALYVGAGIVADSIKKEINGLQTHHGYIPGDAPLWTIEPAAKQGLIESMGIATMRDDNGFINTSVYFDGYNGVKSERYPNGQPNQMVANAINSGTSRRKKNPFITRGINASKSQAESAMAAFFEQDIANNMK